MNKNWLIPAPPGKELLSDIEKLGMELKLPRLVAELLYRKGLRPLQRHKNSLILLWKLYDPLLFPDMEKAVQRI
jgi:hypothetical protein